MNGSVPLILLCAVFFRAVLASDAHASSPITEAEFDCGVVLRQSRAERDTGLNPENFFGLEDGLLTEGEILYDARTSGRRASLALNGFAVFEAHPDAEAENAVCEAFVSIPLPIGFLDVGKKRITQSVSFFKSPVDFALGETGRYDLRYSEGRFAANLELFTDAGFFGFSYMPEIEFPREAERWISSSQKSRYLARCATAFSSFETGAAVSFTDRWQAGAFFSTTVGEHLEAHGEYAFHETKERSDLSFSDGAASAARVTARNCSEGIIGCALHFEKISAIVECYLNQSAYNDEQWERVRRYCRTIAGGRSSNPLYYYNLGTAYRSLSENSFSENSRRYAMIRLSNPADENRLMCVNTVVNLQDFSGVCSPELGYSGWKNAAVRASLSLPFGREFTEFKMIGESWEFSFDLELTL